jgi:MFS transporter, SHS family, lactate transporter
VTIVLQSGGFFGGVIGGYLTKYSVKWVPTAFAVICAPLLPLFILPSSWEILAVGAFFFELFYAGSMAGIGNILQMVCPHPGIRGAFGGVTYNLGSAISAVAPSIETKLAEDIAFRDGTLDYGRVILIFCGIVSLSAKKSPSWFWLTPRQRLVVHWTFGVDPGVDADQGRQHGLGFGRPQSNHP